MSGYLSRRAFLKQGSCMLGTAAAGAFPVSVHATEAAHINPRATVYFSKEISPEAMLRLYGKINQNIGGNIALKVHTGEPHGRIYFPLHGLKTFKKIFLNPLL